MKRLAAGGFAALVMATLGAFFITQHLKVSDPLIAGVSIYPTWINPSSGRTCEVNGRPLSFRAATVSFFLPDHNDNATVTILNSAGDRVSTLGRRYMRQGQRMHFSWDGRETGGAYAPDGDYNVEVSLRHEGRSFMVSDTPIKVETRAQAVKLEPVTVLPRGAKWTASTTATTTTSTGLSAQAAARTAGARVITPGRTVARISFTAGASRGGKVLIYRATVAGHLHLLGSYLLGRNQDVVTWNGKLNHRPLAPGAYLIGVEVTDYACNVARFPQRTSPPLGSTAGAGVTINYLSLATPSAPVTAGSTTHLTVHSHGAAYDWTLRTAGTATVLARGSVPAGAATDLAVGVPVNGAGLDVVTLSAGAHHISAPLLVNSSSSSVLVVVPALSWQGENPVDSTGDGIPATLTGGDWVGLSRPLIDGLPSGFSDLAALLHQLNEAGDSYAITSDLALAAGAGPTLAGHSGVLLAGSFRWLPATLVARLRSYVTGGGRVVAIGVDSLMGSAQLKSTAGGVLAGDPVAMTTDPFGLGRGPLATTQGETFSVLSDQLSLFTALSDGSGSSGTELSGLSAAQRLVVPSGVTETSLIGASAGQPVGVALKLGSGEVVELAVSGFGHSLATSVGSRNLLGGLWQLLEG